MDPHLFHRIAAVHLSKLQSQLSYLVCEFLVNQRVVLPQMFELSVRQVGLVRLIEGLEVVEKCFHHILVEVVVRQELTQSHEYWVT